jgi:DnaJ family protein B protein 12
MDSDKDEAAKCLRIGKAAIEAGDKQRALRFLSMAKRLYPNPQVDRLISSSYEERGGKQQQQAADNRQRHGSRWRSWCGDM